MLAGWLPENNRERRDRRCSFDSKANRDAPTGPAVTAVIIPVWRWRAIIIWRRIVGAGHDDRLRTGRVRGQRRRLHGLHHARADALLLQHDQIVRAQWRGGTVVLDVGEDDFFLYARTCHLDHIVDRDRAGGGRMAEPSFDFGPISGFDIVETATDCRTAQSANAGANRRSGTRISHGIAHNRADTCPAEPAQQCALVGTIWRVATEAAGQTNKDRDGSMEENMRGHDQLPSRSQRGIAATSQQREESFRFKRSSEGGDQAAGIFGEIAAVVKRGSSVVSGPVTWRSRLATRWSRALATRTA